MSCSSTAGERVPDLNWEGHRAKRLAYIKRQRLRVLAMRLNGLTPQQICKGRMPMNLVMTILGSATIPELHAARKWPKSAVPDC
jgi:hypothetical protein